jgi:hypothetical protein
MSPDALSGIEYRIKNSQKSNVSPRPLTLDAVRPFGSGKRNSSKDGRLAGLTNWAVKSKHHIQPYALVIEAA